MKKNRFNHFTKSAKTSKKVCGIDAIPSWLIEKFIQSEMLV